MAGVITTIYSVVIILAVIKINVTPPPPKIDNYKKNNHNSLYFQLKEGI